MVLNYSSFSSYLYAFDTLIPAVFHRERRVIPTVTGHLPQKDLKTKACVVQIVLLTVLPRLWLCWEMTAFFSEKASIRVDCVRKKGEIWRKDWEKNIQSVQRDSTRIPKVTQVGPCREESLWAKSEITSGLFFPKVFLWWAKPIQEN